MTDQTPRRMKANPKGPMRHQVEHDERLRGCRVFGCVPVEAPAEPTPCDVDCTRRMGLYGRTKNFHVPGCPNTGGPIVRTIYETDDEYPEPTTDQPPAPLDEDPPEECHRLLDLLGAPRSDHLTIADRIETLVTRFAALLNAEAEGRVLDPDDPRLAIPKELPPTPDAIRTSPEHALWAALVRGGWGSEGAVDIVEAVKFANRHEGDPRLAIEVTDDGTLRIPGGWEDRDEKSDDDAWEAYPGPYLLRPKHPDPPKVPVEVGQWRQHPTYGRGRRTTMPDPTLADALHDADDYGGGYTGMAKNAIDRIADGSLDNDPALRAAVLAMADRLVRTGQIDPSQVGMEREPHRCSSLAHDDWAHHDPATFGCTPLYRKESDD